MKLIVGLGNPGPQYEATRHNAGFLVVDLLAEAAKISWENESTKFKGMIGRGTLMGQTCVLLKPMTFMNLSGRSVGGVMRFYKIPSSDIVVLHDDLDVPAGKVKAREGGGHGGQNGIRSIIEETGETEFHRIKLGIGRPPHPGDSAVTSWVLGKLTDDELITLQKEMLDGAKLRLKMIFDKGAAK